MQEEDHEVQMLTDAGRRRSRRLGVVWYPCTQMRRRPHTLPLRPIARGEGAWAMGDMPLPPRLYATLLAEALFAPSPDVYRAALAPVTREASLEASA